MMEVSKRFTFEAAHKLPHVPKGHKCGRLHGHSWTVEVVCCNEPDPETGMVIDFADIRKFMQPMLDNALDHFFLNDFINNPTCEHVASWIGTRLRDRGLPGLSRVTVAETCTSSATWRNDG